MTKSIDDLLREALNGRAATTPPASCLDAETAAAFADNSLSAHERSMVEAHVVDCARCQALLAALVRMTPPIVARAWWRRPAIAWLAPITVAATAIIVWVIVPPGTNVAPAVQSVREDARPAEPSTSAAPPAASAPERSEPARDSTSARLAPAPARQQERDRSTSSKNVPAPQPGALADSRVIPAAAAPDAPTAGAQPADAPLPSTSLGHAAAAQAAPAVPPDSRQPAPQEQAAQLSLAETVTVATESARPLARRLEAARESMIVSSNPISRWRIGIDGVVQHSGDGGSTWQTQSTGVNVTLTAGSSPSPSVCWLVGPAGLVLISTDEGRSWQRIAFPVAIDLVSIRATDDKTATVVASDGRTFSTSDRGRNWAR